MEEPQRSGEKIKKAGENLSKVGVALTMAFTVPILSFALFGYLGLFIGVIISLLYIASKFSTK